MYPTKNRPLLGLTASLLALCFSPPTSVCALTNTGLPPDDHIVQTTEQFDGSMNMVAVRESSGNLVIPIVNRVSYHIVATGDCNAQILIFDDHPRAARILTLDNSSSTWTFDDPVKGITMAGLMYTSRSTVNKKNAYRFTDSSTINYAATSTNPVMTERLVRLSRT